MDDDNERQELWDKEFVPTLHGYMIGLMEEKKLIDTGMPNALGVAITRICSRRPADFDMIWGRENGIFEDLSEKAPDLEGENNSFKLMAPRWIMLSSSILTQSSSKGSDMEEKSKISVSTFVKSLAGVFTKIVEIEIDVEGKWVDGMRFVNSILSTKSIVGGFTTAEEMNEARQSLKKLLSPENMKVFLHSLSSAPFISIVLRYHNMFGKDDNIVWELLLKETIPEDKLIDIQNPESLFHQLVAGAKHSKREQFKSPEGVNLNLVEEMTKALKSEGTEAQEKTNLENLYVELIALRGTHMEV